MALIEKIAARGFGCGTNGVDGTLTGRGHSREETRWLGQRNTSGWTAA
jgi:hypothetical protein